MIAILLGVFIVLHGLVHLLYFGQSARFFTLQSGMIWPDNSWVFSKFLSPAVIRNLASIMLILAALGFIAGGTGMFLKQGWWQPMVVSACFLSFLIYMLFWDGNLEHLDNKGGVGILINLGILAGLILLR